MEIWASKMKLRSFHLTLGWWMFIVWSILWPSGKNEIYCSIWHILFMQMVEILFPWQTLTNKLFIKVSTEPCSHLGKFFFKKNSSYWHMLASCLQNVYCLKHFGKISHWKKFYLQIFQQVKWLHSSTCQQVACMNSLHFLL